MKIILFTLVLSFTLFGFGNGVKTPIGMYDNKLFNTYEIAGNISSNGNLNDGIVTQDGDYIFLFTSGSYLYLVKTDTKLNKIWTQKFDNNYRYNNSKLIELKNRNLVIAADFQRSEYAQMQTSVLLLSSDAKEVLSDTYIDDTDWLRFINITEDGGFILRSNVYIIKYDKDLKIEWKSDTAKHKNEYSERFYKNGSFIEVEDGFLFLVDDMKTDYYRLVKIAKDGRDIGSSYFKKSSKKDSYDFRAIVKAKGGFFLFAEKNSDKYKPLEIVQVKIDNDGKEIERKTNRIKANHNEVVFKTKDGYMMLGHHWKRTETDHLNKLAITKIDNNGKVKWEKNYGEMIPELFAGYISASEVKEGYVIFMQMSFSSDDDVIVVKLDHNGNLMR